MTSKPLTIRDFDDYQKSTYFKSHLFQNSWYYMPNHKPYEGILKKKQNIIRAATRPFAEKGYDGISTFQISKAVGVTEPLIYCHLRGKEDLVSHIPENSFKEYFSGLESLKKMTSPHFNRIGGLIGFHFRFVGKMSDSGGTIHEI